MDNIEFNSKELNNGFYKVDRCEVEGHGHITMDNAQKIINLFEAIKRIATKDNVLSGLACNGISLAEDIHNDADLITEKVVKSGLVGYHVDDCHSPVI